MPVTCLRSAALVATMALGATAAQAGNIAVNASDRNNDALANVIVSATPLDKPVPPRQPATALILQEDREFVPAVTVIRAGTKVSFTNRDSHDHHLKSTGATEFEYKIHTKGTPEPLVFDKVGNTIVFCYLHDWMKAYIYVVDTPYFAKTEKAGIALIEGLPEGRYRVASWHPDARSQLSTQDVTITANGTTEVKLNFDLVPKRLGRIKPAAGTKAPTYSY